MGTYVDGPVGGTVALLERLLEGGAFAPKFKLVPHDQLDQLMVFAMAPEAVARGFLELAKVLPSYVVDITTAQYLARGNLIDPKLGERHKFLVTTSDKWSSRAPHPRGYELWSPSGQLGLEAVMLEVGTTALGLMAELTLVLPIWRRGLRADAASTDLVFARFTSNGYCSAVPYRAWTLLPTGETGLVHRGDALACILRIAAKGTDIQFEIDEVGSVDARVGFPGAERFFAAELPSLGEYLVDLAANLRHW